MDLILRNLSNQIEREYNPAVIELKNILKFKRISILQLIALTCSKFWYNICSWLCRSGLLMDTHIKMDTKNLK